jgi:hypothetical protein
VDEKDSTKSPNKLKKSSIIDRKLGIVTYQKWGSVLNYWFSFDLAKGRLLCYKSATSMRPSTYYTLIQGQFVEDDDEIGRKEKIFQKKKNYIPSPSAV